MKRVFICMLSICMLLSGLVMAPETCVRAANAQAEGARLTVKSMVLVKGQYAFIGLSGGAATDKATWSVSGNCARIVEDGGPDGYCYVKGVKAGKGTLKCTVHNKTLKCRIKVLNNASFIGDFCDDSGEVYLDVFKSGKQYVAYYSELRLCTMDSLRGTVKNGILTLRGEDPAGNPITVTVSREGKKRILTFQATTWEYFEQGSTIELKKCSGKKGYGSQ